MMAAGDAPPLMPVLSPTELSKSVPKKSAFGGGAVEMQDQPEPVLKPADLKKASNRAEASKFQEAAGTMSEEPESVVDAQREPAQANLPASQFWEAEQKDQLNTSDDYYDEADKGHNNSYSDGDEPVRKISEISDEQVLQGKQTHEKLMMATRSPQASVAESYASKGGTATKIKSIILDQGPSRLSDRMDSPVPEEKLNA